MAGIVQAIRRQVQPCADRQVNPGPGASRIRVRMRLRSPEAAGSRGPPQVIGTRASTTKTPATRSGSRISPLPPSSAARRSSACRRNSTKRRAAGLVRFHHELQSAVRSLPLKPIIAALLALPIGRDCGRGPGHRHRSRSTSSAGSRRRWRSPSPPCPAHGRRTARRPPDAEIVASDLRSTGLFTPIGPGGIAGYRLRRGVATRSIATWRSAGAAALVAGLRRGQRRRPHDRRLLSLRRHRRPRAGAAGLCRQRQRLAPRRA